MSADPTPAAPAPEAGRALLACETCGHIESLDGTRAACVRCLRAEREAAVRYMTGRGVSTTYPRSDEGDPVVWRNLSAMIVALEDRRATEVREEAARPAPAPEAGPTIHPFVVQERDGYFADLVWLLRTHGAALGMRRLQQVREARERDPLPESDALTAPPAPAPDDAAAPFDWPGKLRPLALFQPREKLNEAANEAARFSPPWLRELLGHIAAQHAALAAARAREGADRAAIEAAEHWRWLTNHAAQVGGAEHIVRAVNDAVRGVPESRRPMAALRPARDDSTEVG